MSERLSRRFAGWLLVAACSALAAPAAAHAPFTVVLSLEELSDGEFLTAWERAPLRDAATSYLVLRPVFPAHCQFQAPRLSCGRRGLAGELGLAGLGDLSSAGIITVHWRDRPRQSFSFSATQRLQTIHDARAPPSWRRTVAEFTLLGVEHILFGWDHLLFVLGLLWLVQTPARLIKTITGFTIAHSITLTAASLGWTHVPVPPIEALIALSIAFVAAEAVKRARDGVPRLTARAPWLVALAFGLLHGFGFASALAEIELPRAQLPLSLLCFNVGVELGQLTFVAAILWLRVPLRRLPAPRRARAARCMHYAAGALAMFWFIERVASFSAPG